MKTVTVYEVSQTQRVLETTYDKIPMQELMRDGGRAWGNPGGGYTFIRYDLPVTHVADERVEDGFVHRRDYYVAIGPRLLELLGPAVNAGLHKIVAERWREIERLEMDAKRRIEYGNDLFRRFEDASRAMTFLDASYRGLDARLRNFREAGLLTRIWRAITRAI